MTAPRWQLALSLSLAVALLADSGVHADPADGPDALAQRAADAYRSGGSGEAAALWRRAAEAFEKGGHETEAARTLVQAADAQQAQGAYADAVATLFRARDLADGQGDPSLSAAIENSLGNAYLALGPSERAREHLERALRIARDADEATAEASVWLNLGNLHASLGAFEEAEHAYSQSAARAEQAGVATVAARAYANAASASLEAGRGADVVRTRLAAALAAVAPLGDSRDKTYLMINVGRTYRKLAGPAARSDEDLRRAYTAWSEARQLADRIDDSLAGSYATGSLGEIYEARRRYDEALSLTRRAVFLAQQARAPESLYRWEWQSGRILRALGEEAASIESYRRAAATIDSIRLEMSQGYASGANAYRQIVEPIHLELVSLLLHHSGDVAESAERQTLLREARATMERLKAAELRDYFQDECVDAARTAVQPLEGISDSAAVIYPILLPDRLELLLGLPSGLELVTVAAGASRVGDEARRLRGLLEKRTTREYLPHARQLYDWLVRPYRSMLPEPVDTLVFVPAGPLRAVPMAALHDGESFLIERYAVAITPGLDLTDPRPLDRNALRLLLSGVSESVGGFPPLSYVPHELGAIQEIHGGEMLLNEDFRLERLERTLREREFNVVHIASHGEFSSDADDSYLLAHDGRISMNQLADYVGLFRFRETPIELLTLSACETARGDARAALGLAGVAIRAGARSALGTLWNVNDEATAELVIEFYQQLGTVNTSKATALQRAQRTLLGREATRHPFYWSPFLLISNWL